MSHLALNLLLAIVWMLLAADFSLASLLIGLVFGFAAIAFARVSPDGRRYVHAVGGTVRLAIGFAWRLVVANLQLARDLLRVRPPFVPGFVRFPIDDLGPTETVVLGSLVSLTPGTLTVDLSDDGTELVVHSLYARDPDEVRRGVRALADLIHGALGEMPTPRGSP